MDAVARDKTVSILSLPTGQGATVRPVPNDHGIQAFQLVCQATDDNATALIRFRYFG